jgi:hypothetical protein
MKTNYTAAEFPFKVKLDKNFFEEENELVAKRTKKFKSKESKK